ncbi:Pseudouridine synthase [Pseudobythopirellula maris]|uniref:Pseudouridine synthase n=1 Tax=Pseudobythopirellula maris TaxID=2527991 RepID=A0A5C5ZWJ9_9BACT|nr:RluA family pseudouridine synthase [Pseudobythopirellula maris]TWT90643.1 Pseudouridine synthase [Pseudobythopirellula maris]
MSDTPPADPDPALTIPAEADNGEPTFPARLIVDEVEQGARLDAFLAKRLNAFSRSVLKRAIDGAAVTVDGRRRKASFRLEVGMAVVVERLEPPPPGPKPEAIDLDFVYEDDDLVAVNKPPGMVVHPAKGHWEGTLASALAHHFGAGGLSSTGGATRPGIVHRLDRDTSGVIAIAKHDRAHERLAKQWADRTVEKEYLAVVQGVPTRDADVIDAAIGPHPKQRERMAIRSDTPDCREAVTRYEVVERFERHAVLRVMPKTGRTHQIRVHLRHLGFPVVCDRLYGHQADVNAAALRGEATSSEPPLLRRQALHASRLRLDQPTSGERLTLEAPLAADIEAVLAVLRAERAS